MADRHQQKPDPDRANQARMAQRSRHDARFKSVCLSLKSKTRNTEDDMTLHCTDLLMQEHRLILRAVYVLQAMAEQSSNFKLPEPVDVERLIRFFKKFADDHHQGKEESILFPALRASDNGKTGGPLRQMIYEHDQERSLVEGLEDALRTRNHADFTYYGSRLATILANHIYKEDHIFFNMIEKTISRPVDAALVAEMEAYDNCACGLSEEMSRLVNDLEWKYLVRGAQVAG
jgi:hemerythrin-like domain-containing protein